MRLSDGSLRWNRVKEVEFPDRHAAMSSSHRSLSIPPGPVGQLANPASKQKVEVGAQLAPSLMTNFLSTGAPTGPSSAHAKALLSVGGGPEAWWPVHCNGI